MTTSRPLSAELEALRNILERLMTEDISLIDLCKHAPRVASVSANVLRIQSALESASKANGTEQLLQALQDLQDEDDEEDAW